jgi:biofilm PGA synthesis N-glycosyltransferase PgaC
MNSDLFFTFRNIAFFFATLMLVKYFVFLLVAPFYKVKEELRKLRLIKGGILDPDETNMNLMVSVIIPAWNEEVGIQKTVNSVLANDYKNFEVIVINDGSIDNSDKIMRDFLVNHPNLQTKLKYYYKKNGGKGSALNYGLKRASGDIILTVDADSILDSHAIKNLVRYFYDSKIDAVVGNVMVANSTSIIGLLQQLEYQFGFYFKRAHAVLNAEYIFGGACSAYRASSVFEQIGNFDTENKTEDIEMSMRIRFFGKHSAYAEDVVCYTEGAASVTGLINQRLRWKKGRFDTFLKYRRLFYSLDRHHNWFLAFFILPFSILAEIQLLFEPISLTLLIAYSVVTNDFVSLFLSSLLILIVYIVTAFFSFNKLGYKTILLYPLTWPLFYVLVWVEYVALVRSIQMVIRGEEIQWQNWNRVGLKLEENA